jgi:hypothetical protein
LPYVLVHLFIIFTGLKDVYVIKFDCKLQTLV